MWMCRESVENVQVGVGAGAHGEPSLLPTGVRSGEADCMSNSSPEVLLPVLHLPAGAENGRAEMTRHRLTLQILGDGDAGGGRKASASRGHSSPPTSLLSHRGHKKGRSELGSDRSALFKQAFGLSLHGGLFWMRILGRDSQIYLAPCPFFSGGGEEPV